MQILKNLNPRERMLALMLAGVAFLILNLVFLPKLIEANRVNRSKHTEIKAQLQAAQGWMAKKEFWEKRRQWLEANEPVQSAARQDTVTQLEALQTMAKQFNLTISDIQLLQLDETPFFVPVGAKVVLEGPWSGLVPFLAELQTPALFDVIPRFSIKSAEEPANVQCEMEIQRWFQKGVEGSQ